MHDVGNGVNERKKDIVTDGYIYMIKSPTKLCLANWKIKERNKLHLRSTPKLPSIAARSVNQNKLDYTIMKRITKTLIWNSWDGVERIIMGFPEAIHTILNWTEPRCLCQCHVAYANAMLLMSMSCCLCQCYVAYINAMKAMLLLLCSLKRC